MQLWGLDLAQIQGGRQPIALCEAAMVPLSLMEWPELYRGRHVVWYVDITSAMHSFVKGAAKDAALARLVNITWMLAFHLRCSIWFEWVDTDTNWADNLSRDLKDCRFTRELGYEPTQMQSGLQFWELGWRELWEELKRLTD